MRLYRASDKITAAQEAMSKAGESDRLYYCYRCLACKRLITKLEMIESRAMGKSNLCPCGGRRVSPTNAHWWEELLLPRCWKLIYAIKKNKIALMPSPPTGEEQKEALNMASLAMAAYEKQLEGYLDTPEEVYVEKGQPS